MTQSLMPSPERAQPRDQRRDLEGSIRQVGAVVAQTLGLLVANRPLGLLGLGRVLDVCDVEIVVRAE
jgi:hypothetical protein